MKTRSVSQIITGRPASDGAGVKLSRVLNPQRPLDPFLMLDEFNSDEADDYVGGFPSHPHRGFETVTYMLEGQMLHEDHLGNRGELRAGGVQWMTAGRGIIHSEMPQQEDGRMRGFQLWINLPAAEKMKPARYQDIAPEQVPVVQLPGVTVRVVAGQFWPEPGSDARGNALEVNKLEADELQGNKREADERKISGPVSGIATEPLYLDVTVAVKAELAIPVTPGHTALVYLIEGAFDIDGKLVQCGQLAVLGDGDAVVLRGGAEGGRALMLAAKPLREPVKQYGPFVMNTMEEIEQALRDYRDGTLTG